MKFEKMDNGSLRCSLTKQDLDNNGVKIEDFFTNNQIARDFLEKLIHMAEQEVGYKTTGNMMSIQAAVVSENDIILTFTEHELKGSDIIERIKNMVSGKSEETAEVKESKNLLTELKEADNKGDTKQDYSYLLYFEKLDVLVRFAKAMAKKEDKLDRVISNVYKYKDTYYMQANLNFVSKSYLYSFVSTGMEYSDNVQKEDSFTAFLQEHGQFIIGPWAMKELGQI